MIKYSIKRGNLLSLPAYLGIPIITDILKPLLPVTRIKPYSENKVIIMFEEKKPWYYNHPIWYGLLLGAIIKILGEVYDSVSLVKAGDLILQVMSVILIIFIIYIVFDTFKTPKEKRKYRKSPYG